MWFLSLSITLLSLIVFRCWCLVQLSTDFHHDAGSLYERPHSENILFMPEWLLRWFCFLTCSSQLLRVGASPCPLCPHPLLLPAACSCFLLLCSGWHFLHENFKSTYWIFISVILFISKSSFWFPEHAIFFFFHPGLSLASLRILSQLVLLPMSHASFEFLFVICNFFISINSFHIAIFPVQLLVMVVWLSLKLGPLFLNFLYSRQWTVVLHRKETAKSWWSCSTASCRSSSISIHMLFYWLVGIP